MGISQKPRVRAWWRPAPTGCRGGSGRCLPWRKPQAVHDPGKILLDVALAVVTHSTNACARSTAAGGDRRCKFRPSQRAMAALVCLVYTVADVRLSIRVGERRPVGAHRGRGTGRTQG
nr:hypothetical protein C5F59_06045 [Streptomyces sp. QL37]